VVRRLRRLAGDRLGARDRDRVVQDQALVGAGLLGAGVEADVGQRALPAAGGATALGRLVVAAAAAVAVAVGLRLRGRGRLRGRRPSPAEQHVGEQHQAFRDLADRRRGDHQQAEDQQQDQQRYGHPGRHRADQQRAHPVPDEPARVVDLDLVRMLGDVQQAGGGHDERRPADHRAAPVLGVRGLSHQPDRRVEQQHREQ